MTPSDFAEIGFALVQERRDGSRQYGRRDNPYLSYWLLARPDGSVELSWEFALGEYLAAKGLSVSAQDEQSLLLFPSAELRGPLERSWIEDAVAAVRERLGSVDLVSGT